MDFSVVVDKREKSTNRDAHVSCMHECRGYVSCLTVHERLKERPHDAAFSQDMSAGSCAACQLEMGSVLWPE